MKIWHFITLMVLLFLGAVSAFSSFSGLTAILIWHEEPQIQLRKPKPLKGEIIAPLEGLNLTRVNGWLISPSHPVITKRYAGGFREIA
jgi:hypothetical protein